MIIKLTIGGFEKEFTSIQDAHKALEEYSKEKAESVERAEKFNALLRQRCDEYVRNNSEFLSWVSQYDGGSRKDERLWMEERIKKTVNTLVGAVRKIIRVRMGSSTNANFEIVIRNDVEGTCFSILDDILPPIKGE